MSEPKPLVGAIFEAALQLPREERNAHVLVACAGDDALKRRVMALLNANEAAGTFMLDPAAMPRPDSPMESCPEAISGQTIGRYKLLEKLGIRSSSAVWPGRGSHL